MKAKAFDKEFEDNKVDIVDELDLSTLKSDQGVRLEWHLLKGKHF